MGLISTYPNATTPLSSSDTLIGTDANDMDATKTFTVDELASYIQSYIATNMAYGSFYDITNQTAAAINTAYPMKFSSVDSTATNGVSIGTNSGASTLITLPNVGVYNIQFSAQLNRTSGGSAATVDIWLKDFTNNANVPSTNTSVNVQANANYLVAAWNFFFKAGQPNHQLQIMWATTDTAVTIAEAAATALHPLTPSVILTVNQIA